MQFEGQCGSSRQSGQSHVGAKLCLSEHHHVGDMQVP